MTNILTDTNINLGAENPYELANKMAMRLRERRLEKNLSQQLLARKSGVSLGTLKRFESLHEISLKHLLMLAVVLEATEEFHALFARKQYQSIEEVLKSKVVKMRQRGKSDV